MSSFQPRPSVLRGASTLVLMLLLAPIVAAQSYRGSIRGSVLAENNAVPGANVVAKNIATGQTRNATTADDGSYVLAELPAGEYEVTAQAKDLTLSVQRVTVSVGLDTTANFSLRVAAAGETLTIQETAPLIETSRDVLGQVVQKQLVEQLPLNGRDFGKLVALVPGTTVEPSGVAAIQSGFGQFSINGNRDRSNNYTLDGTDNNDPFFNNSALNQTGIGGAPASLLPIDAIQEFNLQSQFGAEYGRNTGSIINIITKSGTNQFHGILFEFVRNDMFDARNFFNRAPNPQTAFRNNQFGASLGGPIIHSKTFFFGAFEGQRERVGSDFVLQVPTQAQIQAAEQLALSNGLITQVNPALIQLLKLFPPPSSVNPLTGTGAAAIAVKDQNDVNSFIAKLDHSFTLAETLSVRYAFADSQQIFPLGGLGGGAASRLPQFAQSSPTRVQIVSASLLSTISSQRINEVRFGYSRYRTSFSSLDQMDTLSQLGINFGTSNLGLPEIDFAGFFDNLGTTGFSVPKGRVSQSFQLLDNFTWMRGKHAFKFGGEVRRAAINSFNDNLQRGLIEFAANTGVTSDPAIDTLVSYFAGVSFFSPANTGNTHRTTFNNGVSFFFQDDWRVTPKLTLNAGLRWEYFGPLSEKNGLLSNWAPDGSGLQMVGTHGLNGAYNHDLNDFGPRLGFAWNLLPKTVVRAAYGIYYDYVPQDLLIANFTNSAGLVTNPIGPKPVTALAFSANAWTGALNGPVFFSPPTSTTDIFITPRNFATPYVQNWNMNVQQQLGGAMSLEVGYIGSKGTRLVRLLDANQPDITGTRPNGTYGFIDTLASVSSSTYNAAQLNLRMKSWRGISGFGGYTFSKSLDDASDGIDFNFATVALPQNSHDLHAEHGPSNFDTRHRFTVALSYAVPVFESLPRRVGQGWALNTVFVAQSGRPVPIVCNCDTSAQNGSTFPTPANFHQRPNVVPGVNPINSNWETAPDVIGYINGNAFAAPPSGTFGNLGRNEIYGPSFWQTDFSLLKATPINERIALQIRAEFFNIFNHPNFALPNFFVNPGATSGLITQTPDVAQTNPGLGGGGPRVLQLGAKITF